MSPQIAVGVCTAILAATLAQQISGFGFGLLAVPLAAAAVGPRDAVAIAAVTGIASSGLMSLRLRDRVHRVLLGRLLLGAVVGLPVGVVGLRLLDERVLRLALAVVVLGMVLVLARGFRLDATGRHHEVGAGVLSGLLGGSIGTGGPPVVVLLHATETEQHVFRATTTAFFAASNAITLPLVLASGAVRSSAWSYGAASIPVVLVGTVVGERLARRVPPDRFRAVVLGLLTATGAMSLLAALS